LRPFFLFFFSSFLGFREASSNMVLDGMSRTNLPSTWEQISRQVGDRFPVNLGANFPSQLGTSIELCPKRLWINLSNPYGKQFKHVHT
jgi:hypothetical protein